jgi:UDP-N-acetylglucosamine--dolichyl-phosphate N-acetylglucosaminephosphotransferase
MPTPPAPGPRPRPLPPVLLLSLVPVALWFVGRPLLDPAPPLPALHASLGFSIFAFVAALYLVPALGPILIKARLSGRDLLKTYDAPMYALHLSIRVRSLMRGYRPESLGLVCASIYILLLILFIPFPFSQSFADHRLKHAQTQEGLVTAEFPHHQVRSLSRPHTTISLIRPT